MDASIRKLIQSAEETGDVSLIEEAHEKLRRGRNTTSDLPDPFGSDLFVICAETALDLDRKDIMESCMKLFFLKTPPNNQFLGRAYLCQAKAKAPKSAAEMEQFELAVDELTKVMSFGRAHARYHFLVYNASVLYWSFARPFMKPHLRQQLAKSLHLIVKALDEIEDKDYEWRVHLMISLIECHIDAGKRDEAAQVCHAAMQLTRAYTPHLTKEIFAIQIRFKLIDANKINILCKASQELSIYNRMLKYKFETNPVADMKAAIDLGTIVKSIAEQSTEDRSAVTASPSGVGRDQKVVQIQITDKERCSLLIELMRLCLELKQPEVAQDCNMLLASLTTSTAAPPEQMFELEFMRCELLAAMLRDKSELYTKACIDVRLKAIRQLEEHLMAAVRTENEDLVQIGCVTMWNLCLPLLQNNVRQHVRKPLTTIATMLENIESLLHLIRCQIHFELAKCEEEEEQMESAISNLLKALALDDTQVYKKRLDATLQRYKLRILLYQAPERPEDLACMIIEQASHIGSSKSTTNTTQMKRASLVKAGLALAPDAFMLAMDSEEAVQAFRVSDSTVVQLAEKVKRYRKGVAKIAAYLKRLEGGNDRESCRIWADLAKTARKQQVWDVARIASLFCLMYDDGRWSKLAPAAVEEFNSTKSVEKEKQQAEKVDRAADKQSTAPSTEIGVLSQDELHGDLGFTNEEDLLRMLAEINFVYGESLVQLLQTEGLRLFEEPLACEDTKLRPKKYEENIVKNSETPEWATYKEWTNSIAKEAIARFQRAAEIGSELGSAWLVCNAGIYAWNYLSHLTSAGAHRQLTEPLQPIFDALAAVGHADETAFLCELACCLAHGYLQPYIPAIYFTGPLESKLKSPHSKSDTMKPATVEGKSRASGMKPKSYATDPAAMADLKKACEVLEYALSVTSGAEPRNLIPIANRHALLKAYVLCKGLMGQPLGKGYLDADAATTAMCPQAGMNRALCNLELLANVSNDVLDTGPQCPKVEEVITLVEAATWTDILLEIQVWSRLAVLLYNVGEHDRVVYCADVSIRLGSSSAALSQKIKRKKSDLFEHKLMVEQEMLYYASVVKGQSLVAQMNGRMEVRRKALLAFVDACKYASKGGNYELAMTAAKHYWNTIHPLISVPIERGLLNEPIRKMLKYISLVAKNIQMDDEPADADGADSPCKPTKASPKKPVSPEKAALKNSSKAMVPVLELEESKSQLDEDLKLRAALYAVLFQSYADKGELEAGLVAMNEAVTSMPRTHHRLLIFKHRVMTNAELGKPVTFDMQKFKDENESLLAHMWNRVAKHSEARGQQMSAYVNAIDVLTDPDNLEQKLDYLVEFAEWLFVNEFPRNECLDQLSSAISMLVQHTTTAAVTTSGGSVGPGTSDELSHMTNIRHMDILIRLLVIYTEMSPRSGPHFQQHCLSAAFLAQHIVQTSLVNAEKAVREGIPPGEIIKAPPKEGKEGKKKDAAKEKKPNRNVKSSIKPILPDSLESWAVYQIPDKYKEHFLQDFYGNYISKKSIGKPMLTIHYLDKLCGKLEGLGFHQFTVPVMLYMSIISDVIVSMENLRTLIHMKLASTCLHLNMLPAYSFHQKTTDHIHLTEQEQADLREEIEEWHEKQNQVKAEQLRQANNPVAADTPAVKLKSIKQVSDVLDVQSIKPVQHTKELISGPNKRHIWMQMASHLIGQNQFQVARQLLEEANLSALAFDDRDAQQEVNYLSAEIAFRENDWGRVISLLEPEIHSSPALTTDSPPPHTSDSQSLWLRKVVLLADALHLFAREETTFVNHCTDSGFARARDLLNNSIQIVSRLTADAPNSTHLGEFIIAKLTARLGMLFYDESKEPKYQLRNMQDTAVDYLASASANIVKGYTMLNEIGHPAESISLMVVQVRLQLQLALNEEEVPVRKQKLMDVLALAQEAISHLTMVTTNVTNHSMQEDVSAMFLPAQTQLVEVQLACVDVMEEMVKFALAEDREKNMEYKKKQRILKVIDDYVGYKPELSALELSWQQMISLIHEQASLILTAIFSLTDKVPILKARACMRLGEFLSLLARYNSADSFYSWDENVVRAQSRLATINKQEAAAAALDSSADATGILEQQATSAALQQVAMTTHSLIEFQKNQQDLLEHGAQLAQAIECLMQAIQLGLKHGLADILQRASFQLVENLGKRDVETATKMLALFQSAHASQAMERLLTRAFIDPHRSRSAALLRQHEAMKSQSILQKSLMTSPMSVNFDSLQECEWWRHLTISKNHFDIVKDLPFFVTFVILQHSADGSQLYGAVMDKSRNTGPNTAKKRADAASTPVPPQPKVLITRTPVSRAVLTSLLSMAAQFSSAVSGEHMRTIYARQQKRRRKELLGSKCDAGDEETDGMQRLGTPSTTVVEGGTMTDAGVAPDATDGAASVGKSESFEDPLKVLAEEKLTEMFDELLAALQAYLGPVLDSIGRVLQREPASDSLILLADTDLLRLPLEALPPFRAASVSSVSRDVSLQMFNHRLKVDTSGITSRLEKGGKGGKESKSGKGRDLKQSTSATQKKDNAKDKKAAHKDFVMDKDGVLLDINTLKYVIDPMNDFQDCDAALSSPEAHPSKMIAAVMNKHKPKCQKWMNAKPNDDLQLTVKGVQEILTESSALLVSCSERFLAHVAPSCVAPLNLFDCNLLLLGDLMQTSSSYLRQGSQDASKSPSDLALERPMETCMLLSLAGVHSIVAGQWHTTAEASNHRIECIFDGLLAHGQSVGQAVRALHAVDPPLAEVTEGNVSAMSQATKTSAKDKAGSVKGRKNSLSSIMSDKPLPGEHMELISELEPISIAEAPPVERLDYEQYNTVVYGVPNFLTSLQHTNKGGD